MAISRRQVLAGGAALSAMAVLKVGFAGQAFAAEGFGPLVPDPEGLLDLPVGFSYRVFGRGPSGAFPGDRMTGLDGTDWGFTPPGHDGMAAFNGPRGTTILVRNHELGIGTAQFVPGPTERRYDTAQGADALGNPFVLRGGTTTLVLDRNHELIASYPSIAGTSTNCAGGPTPWGSWLTCEETTLSPASDARATKPHGYIFEVPSTATGPVVPVAITPMGRFSHEAICVDPSTGIVYETEDSGSSVLYRYRPNEPGRLAAGGVLEALRLVDYPGGVSTARDIPIGVALEADWVPVPNPDALPGQTSTSAQAREQGAAVIARGEGIWWSPTDQAAYVVSTSGGQAGRGQVFRYSPRADGTGTLELFIEAPAAGPDPNATWAAPDNITVAPWGDLVICEDGGGDEFLWMVSKARGVFKLARNAQGGGEFAGATFSRDGRTLFVNVQSPGATFAITGPFRPLHSTPGY